VLRHASTKPPRCGPKHTRTICAQLRRRGHLRSDEDLRDAHRDAADAKARIAVYGTVDVIKALARFEESGAVLSNGPASRAFVSLVSAMRPKSGDVSEHELELLLLGALPKTTLHELRSKI
jgi:hypothetical protein